MIAEAFKQKIKAMTRALWDKRYREFIYLLFRYGRKKANVKKEIRFLNYKVNVPDNLSFIFQYKEIFVKQAYKFRSETSSPLIYDCGSNIGISCIYFKELFPGSRIKAFEADPSIAEILKSNIAKNSLSGIEVTAKAVWINNDGISFSTDGKDGGSVYGNGNKISVPTVRLKDLIENEEKIDFLKIDIEGAETAVLKDCMDVLYKADKVFVEYHSWRGQEPSMDEVLEVLRKNGFRYYLEPITGIEEPLFDGNLKAIDVQVNIFAER